MIKEKKLRPGRWATGPDPVKHMMYMPFLRARAQAKFRSETWLLTFDDYFQLWNGKWDRRGHKGDNLCMTRHDIDAAWTVANTFLITRSDLQYKLDEYRKSKGIIRKTRGPGKKK